VEVLFSDLHTFKVLLKPGVAFVSYNNHSFVTLVT